MLKTFKKAEAEVARIIRAEIPGLRVRSIDVRPTVGFEGRDALEVRVVYSRRPPDSLDFAQQRFAVGAQFRAWLYEMDEERLPLFTYWSEAEEREVLLERIEDD
ncbi:MAG TPA: hypothetical protein DCL54_06275 [Alphaproteobacteria bacterium]|nr:hypothetical protein [Alphaproteobacteria bacterium]HAJ46169.1 hypothetical protein [Alphaproteobacteria bacterium]